MIPYLRSWVGAIVIVLPQVAAAQGAVTCDANAGARSLCNIETALTEITPILK